MQALDDGEIGVAHRFGLNINEESLKRNVRRWREKEDERGHLRNHKRGLEPGVKFCLDGTELEVLQSREGAVPGYVPRRGHPVDASSGLEVSSPCAPLSSPPDSPFPDVPFQLC